MTNKNEKKVFNVRFLIFFLKTKKRINGEGTENFLDRGIETKIVMEASKYKQGPELYAIFDNGSVYEFIEGKSLSHHDLPKHAEKIAKNMNLFHQMDIQCLPKINGLFPFLNNLYKQGNKETFNTKVVPQKIKNENFKSKFEKLTEEFEFIENVTKNYELAFCHNDLLGMKFY
jgi:thiamine kinase-like enzyme